MKRGKIDNNINIEENSFPITKINNEMRFKGKEYLLCSAIHYDDGNTYKHQPKNIDSGIVICGRRHHNCFLTLSALLGDKYDVKLVHSQGFVTNKDRYLERKKAAQLAFECEQIPNKQKTIFSEDLW